MRSPTRAATLATLLLAALAAPPRALSQDALDPVERRIADEISGRAEEAYALLERLVEINSGTYNPRGVKAVADVLGKRFAALGFEVEWVVQPPEVERGGHLVARR